MAVRKMNLGQRLVLNYYRAKINLLHVVHPGLATKLAIGLFQRPYARARVKDPPIWVHATTIRFSSGGKIIQAYHWQPQNPDSIKRLLILHGFAGDARKFDRYIKPALNLGYHVYAMDAPAHGKSQGKHLNVLAYCWAIEDFLKTEGPFEAYIAHSLGCMALLLALEKNPHWLAKKLALIASLVEVTTATQSFKQILQMRLALQNDFDSYLENWAGRPLQFYSLPRLLQQVQAPTLLIHDEHDETTPIADLGSILKNPPSHVQLFITQHLGHNKIYKDNRVKRAVLQFLTPQET